MELDRRRFCLFAAGLIGALAGVSRRPSARGEAQAVSLDFLHQPGPDELTLLTTGDSIVYRSHEELRGAGYDELFRMQRECDLAVTNCELVLSTRGYPKPKDVARADPSEANHFVWQGIDVVSLGNNHAMDLGPEGLLETIQALDQRKIVHVGGGRNLDEANSPAVVTRKGIRVGFLSYLAMSSPVATDSAATADRPGLASIRGFGVRVPGTGDRPRSYIAPEDVSLQRMERAIQEARPKADFLLVAYHMHWGARDEVDEGRKIIARAAIDSGADVVIAHGPHVINPVERYKGRLIFYSLGNFFFHIFERNAPAEFFGANWPIRNSIFNFTTSTDYWEALAVRFVIGRSGLRRVQVLPIVLDRSGNPRLPGAELGAAIAEDFRAMSAGMGVEVETRGWHVEIKV